MKASAFRIRCAVATAMLATLLPVSGKPPGAGTLDPAKKTPPAATSSPTPAQATENSPALALARWLIQAPSGGDAIALPFTQVFSAASGKHVLPFDPGNPADKETLAKIGGALDAILPILNRTDSPARNIPAFGTLRDVAARFDGELLARLLNPTDKPVQLSGSYPAFSYTEPKSTRVYYLGTTLFQTGDDPAPSLNFDPLARGQDADGVFLLVGIEHNGKSGGDITFLNWQVLDMAKLKVHFAPNFQTNSRAALQQGTVLTDGRKGRD